MANDTAVAFCFVGQFFRHPCIEIIAQAPFPPRLIPNVPPPQLPIPGLKEAVEEAGTFDVTVLDESDDVEKLLVARSARGEVRVFAWAQDVNV